MARLFALLALLLAFTGLAITPEATMAAEPVSASAYNDPVTRHIVVPQRESKILTLTVRRGDTYGKWATQYCGTFGAWPAIQAANGWPATRIPAGAKAVIACYGYTDAPPAVAKWVHPLASGATVQRLRNCFRTSGRPGHGGVDISQPSGTAIRSVAAGIVHRKGFERNGAGHYITIRHDGNVYTQYHHLAAASPIGTGKPVTAGQTIGRVGATGNATGPHLHFEVRTPSLSRHENPADFMRTKGVNLGC